MVFCKLISISCVVLLTCKVKASMDKATDENLKDLHFVQKNLDENIKPDLIKILSQQISLTKELNENLKQIKTYVEDSIVELKEFVMKQMNTSDTKIMENVNLLKENTKESFENIAQMMFTNDQALNESSSIETDAIIEWAHSRFGKHEDIMRTHISICAFTFGHFGRGVVDYSRDADSGFLEETQYQIDNKTCVNNKDQCLENILNRQEGTFTVPENMAGVYEFTFTVLMDTYNHHLDASNYIFRKNGENIKGTDIYGEAGFNDSHDKILATRTINLFLQVGDKVDVDQITDSDTPDHRITFCGTLLHQDRVSLELLMKTIEKTQ